MKGFPKGDPRARAAGQKGGALSGVVRWRKALAKIQQAWPGMPREAAHVIHVWGDARFRAGMQARRRAFALGETDTRRRVA